MLLVLVSAVLCGVMATQPTSHANITIQQHISTLRSILCSWEQSLGLIVQPTACPTAVGAKLHPFSELNTDEAGSEVSDRVKKMNKIMEQFSRNLPETLQRSRYITMLKARQQPFLL